MIIVIATAEIGVRVATPRLAEPLRYFSGRSQTVVNDMNVLKANGIRSRVTFVGTSMVRRDVDAARVEKELKWPDTSVHNVALPGAQTTVVQRWLLEEVVPRLRPNVVVWGVSTLDFNSGRPDHPIDQYNAARASQDDFFGRLDRIMENSALSEHRDALRDPYELKAAAQDNATHYKERKALKARASWRLEYDSKTPAQLKKMKANHLITVRDKQLRNFQVGADELTAFRDTIKELQSRGIKVVVVIMPVPSDYLPLHPRGEQQFIEWQRQITDEAQALNATVIDNLVRSMADADFRDYEHLWPKPARENFTPKLAKQLSELPWWKSVFPK